MTFEARIEGVGLAGPGLAGWVAAREILAGRAPWIAGATVLPPADSLPATERRRAGKCVRLSLAAGLEAAREAGREARDLVAIFTSSSGDGDNCHAICDALASDDRLISPTRFHNSVHNAPAGYWGIATGATRATDCLGAFDSSFCAGLVEAMGRLATEPGQPVLVVAYDAPYPEPLNSARPMPDSFAVALVLSRAADAVSAARAGMRIALRTTRDAATPASTAGLEAIRASIPAARSLPLLERLARAAPGRIVLQYLDDLALEAELLP
jgi:hypothetical protein